MEMSMAYMNVGQFDPMDDRYTICETDDDDDIDWNEYNEREERELMERQAKEPVWCTDICRLSQHCIFGKKEIGKDPDHCSEYIKLEDYEWDAYQDKCAEDDRYESDYEDDDDWEE